MKSPARNQRRRIIRTTLVTGWNGASLASKVVDVNTGLAQHQIYIASNSGPPVSGLFTVFVRPAKSTFYVPVGTIDPTKNTSGQVLLRAIIDAVKIVPTIPSSSGVYEAGIVSVNDDFTASEDAPDTDRRRFGVCNLATGWNGSASVTDTCLDQSGFTQHQIAISGGTGTVRLYGRPVGAASFVYIDYGTDALDASGSLAIFPGCYDAYLLAPNGPMTGSISAQIISVGNVLFFPPTAAEIAMAQGYSQNDVFIFSSNGLPLVTSAGDLITSSGA